MSDLHGLQDHCAVFHSIRNLFHIINCSLYIVLTIQYPSLKTFYTVVYLSFSRRDSQETQQGAEGLKKKKKNNQYNRDLGYWCIVSCVKLMPSQSILETLNFTLSPVTQPAVWGCV